MSRSGTSTIGADAGTRSPVPHRPKARLLFALEEYQRRLDRVQTVMEMRDLPLLLVHSAENICYLSGFQTSGTFAYSCLIVPASGKPALVIRNIERGWVDEYSWLEEAVTWRDGESVAEVTAAAVADMVHPPAEIGVDLSSRNLTVAQFDALKGALAPSRLVDASLLVDRVRVIKSDAEVALIREAARAVDAGLSAAIENIADGASELQVAAAIHSAMILAGSEYTALPHYFSSGYRTRMAHANWSPKKMHRGENCRTELTAAVGRYHAGGMRTVCIGPPNDEVRSAADLLLSSQDAFIAALHPGAISGEVDAIVRGPVRRELNPGFYNRTGYSIGIGFPPTNGEANVLDFNESSDWMVEEGMVFHLVTGAVGSGVAFSDTVVVQAGGAERLTTVPRQLFVVE